MSTRTDDGLVVPSADAFAAKGASRAAFANSVAAVFAGCLVVAVIARGFGLFPSVIDWDESLYAVMAQHWLEGGLPYATVWDQHSIGLPALFAAILHFFPKSIVAIRLSACVAVAITATTLYFATRLLDRRVLPAAAAAFLYIAWTTRLWGFSANTELYINALVAVAMYVPIWLSVRRDEGTNDEKRRIALLCLSALLLGIAMQIKHVVVAETAFFFAVAFLSGGWRSRKQAWLAFAAAGTCFLLPTIAAITYFTAAGLAQAYFRAVVEANLIYIVSRPDFAEVWPVFPKTFAFQFAIFIAAAILMRKRASRPSVRPWLLALGWAAASVIDALLPGQFWAHYFLLLLPASAVLTVYLGVALFEARPRFAKLALPMALLILIYPPGIYRDIVKVETLAEHDTPAILAEQLAARLSPDDSIFVFNYQPILYLLSGARLPTRHVLPADWSWRYRKATGVDPTAELNSVFQHQPKFVVFIDRDWQHMGAAALAALRRHLSAYVMDSEVVDNQILPEPAAVEVYRRK